MPPGSAWAHLRLVRVLHALHHLAGAGVQKVQHGAAGGGDQALGPPRQPAVALARQQRQAGGEDDLRGKGGAMGVAGRGVLTGVDNGRR